MASKMPMPKPNIPPDSQSGLLDNERIMPTREMSKKLEIKVQTPPPIKCSDATVIADRDKLIAMPIKQPIPLWFLSFSFSIYVTFLTLLPSVTACHTVLYTYHWQL
jgi:hypothetical protein